MTKEEIYDMAKDVKAKLKAEIKHMDECLSSAICPTCGENLVYLINDGRVACPNKHQLTHPVRGDLSWVGSPEYGNELMPNQQIRNAYKVAHSND